MARRFLYLVAVVIGLVLAGLLALRLWTRELAEIAFVPSTGYVEQSPLDANAFQDPALWYSRPGFGVKDPARWLPKGQSGSNRLPQPSEPAARDFSVFFIHPTSYLDSAQWNAPRGDAQAEDLARRYVKLMASPFNQAGEIWAPRYRQATIGAFLTDAPDGQKAIDAAYADVAQAFAFFLLTADKDAPIVLVGHSQGALHLLHLLREEVAGKPLARRIAAAYVVGWPISVEHDLPALGLAACDRPDRAGCIVSWSSYAEPADPSDMLEVYARTDGFDGQPRGSGAILCTNPLTGRTGGSAPGSANLGTLVPALNFADGEIVRRAVPARCDARGLLLIGDPPAMGPAVLPGNNYHAYDIPLFWANLRADVRARVDAWKPAR